jgi:hypothetical protein
MNFNVYLNKAIRERMTKIAKITHRSRNSIVNEALEEWLNKHASTEWPKGFFDFEPINDVPNFKDLRSNLKSFLEDPLE